MQVTATFGAKKAISSKISGKVYSATSFALSNTVSTQENPVANATVKIYKVINSNTQPSLITTTSTDSSGAYSQNLILTSSTMILVVAQKDNSAIGQAMVAYTETTLTDTASQSLQADISILSSLTARILIKKNVELQDLNNDRLAATLQIVRDKIAANSSTEFEALFSTLASSSTFISSLVTATTDQGASENRAQTAFDAITAVLTPTTTSTTTTGGTGSSTTTTTSQVPPPDPTGLGASADSSTQLTVSWTSGGGTTASYKIAYQTGATAPSNCSTGTVTTSTTTSVTISGLVPGTQYAFRICSLNSNGTPDESSGVTTTAMTSAFVISGWSYVDGNTAVGLNKNTTQTAATPKLTTFNSKLYSIWSEGIGGGINNIRVAVYSGNDSSPSWSFVDGNGATGINKNSATDAIYPNFVAFNSKLYATWVEGHQIRMAVYNGNDSAPSWSFVDGNGVNGINKDPARWADSPALAVFNSKLYATWSEQNGVNGQIRTAVYNGNDSSPIWSFIDGDGVDGINKDPTQSALTPNMLVTNSKLYISWSESNGFPQQARVAVYNGNDGAPAWTFVDGNAATGLNRDPAQGAYAPRIYAFNSKIYLTWYEHNGTAIQVRVKVYNGNDGAPSWAFVDGGGAPGLNKDTSQATSAPQLTALGSTLYATWSEGNATQQIRVAAYNGNDSSPSWSFSDGNGVNGINKDVTKAALEPQLGVFNSKLYATWREINGAAYQIRAAVAQ